MKITLLGVPIDAVTRQQALDTVAAFLQDARGRFVATPNPEMLVLARRDPEFRKVIASADLAVPDGAGLLWAAKRAGTPLPERVTGTDLMQDIAGLAARLGKRIFLLGGAPGVAEQAADELRKKHDALAIVGAMDGGRVRRGTGGGLEIDPAALAVILATRPDILFVAFGHGTQEKWIAQNLPRLAGVRLAMGVGGAFDFIAGKAKRAPRSWQELGLEWLWRLLHEPRRFRRIWDAVVVFPFLLINEKH